MDGDAPVEIELTPTSTRPSRFRLPGRPAPDQPGATEAEPAAEVTAPRWTDEFSRRVVVTIACVGVGALVVGWALGRASGDDPDQVASATETTSPSPDTSPTIPGETLPAVELDPVPPTTGVPRTTTTIVLVDSVAIEVAPALAGAEYELVGLSQGGNLLELDLTTGDLLTRRDLETGDGGGSGRFWAGDGWVLIPDWNTGSMFLVEDGQDPVGVRLGEPWTLLVSEVVGEFWVLDQAIQMGATGNAQRVDRFGEEIGAPIELSDPPRFSDPAGGLIVESSGSTYRVDADGATKIVDGSVLALDESRVVARTCDAQLLCGYIVLDRATGETRSLPTDPSIRYQNYWWGTDTSRISPDGRWMVAVHVDTGEGGSTGIGSPILSLIDIDTGATRQLSAMSNGTVVWSPDGRFVLYDEAGLAMAHDIATGESFVVSDDLPRLSTLAVRSSEG